MLERSSEVTLSRSHNWYLIYFLPFTIAAEFLWLVSLIPGCHLVHGGPPSNFLKCFSSCTVLHSLQIFRKKSNLTPPPHSDPKGQNKRSHYFHWKTPRFFLLLLQYVAFQTLPVLFFVKKKAFLSPLAILWNSAFSWVYLSLSSLLFDSLFVKPPWLLAFLFLWDGFVCCLLCSIMDLCP